MSGKKTQEPEKEERRYAETAFWIDPAVHTALIVIVDDIIRAYSDLAAQIPIALEEVRDMSGDFQVTWFRELIHKQEEVVAVRMDMYRLFAAISCENLINRFCYFELPKETSELIEKLQPTEKLLMIADFLKKPKIKSTHLYEGLKAVFEWRNRFAHGHNPDLPAKSLRKNHADWSLFQKLSSTFEEELRDLQKAAVTHEQLILWLKTAGVNNMTRYFSEHPYAAHATKVFQCFRVKRKWFPPDPEGGRYSYIDVEIDTKRLDKLLKSFDPMSAAIEE